MFTSRKIAVFCVAAAGLCACAEPAVHSPELLATYAATPAVVVDKMLELAVLRPGDKHYDLGSGDGRIVIAAAERYRARSIGFEIDAELLQLSRSRIAERGLEALARVEDGDLALADFSQADAITSYLTPEGHSKIVAALTAKMKPGARLVSYKFEMPGWSPEQTVRFDDTDPSVPEHIIYCYRR
jgi:cyclopropane fatty-acyl-phospholipid synthase-like methyltransferase